MVDSDLEYAVPRSQYGAEERREPEKRSRAGAQVPGAAEATIIAPLETPPQIAARMGDCGANWMIKSATVPIKTPIQSEATDATNPAGPRHRRRTDAQAMKVTQTGSGSTVAVR